MENTSDSEIPNSSPSLFLPSEPPDIRNWFPSYKYESFVLDTYDTFGGSEFKESDRKEDGYAVVEDENREKEENLGESGRNGDSEAEHEEQSLSRMPDSTCSLPILSEPPHLRNWFSSYVYESPVLDTVEDFKGSVVEESGCEKEGFAFGGSDRERIVNSGEHRNFQNSNKVDAGGEKLKLNRPVKSGKTLENTCENNPSNEIPDSPQTPSTLSEPPDIRNWFFSYVYKSPESNVFDDNETECEGDGFVDQHKNEKERNPWESGQTRIIDEVFIDEKVNSNGVLRFTSSLRGDAQEKKSLNKGNKAPVNECSSNHGNLCCKSRQNLEDNIFFNHGIGSTKGLEKASLNDEAYSCKQQVKQNFLRQADAASFQSKDRGSQTVLIHRKDLSENVETKAQTEADLLPPAGNIKFVQGSGDLKRKSSCGINGKEKEEKEVPGNGFISTKNRSRPNNENSLLKPKFVLQTCSRNEGKIPSYCANEAIERRVLSERTNLEQNDAIGFTGKWQCPQKSKPKNGPPLKQLRLERWINRP